MDAEKLRAVFRPKILFLILLVVSVALIGFTYAEEKKRYGDLRDYYPYGLWITATKIETLPSPLPPSSHFANITYDPYVEKAIETGNETWVQQDDPNSEYMQKGIPTHIKWVPDGNYYQFGQVYIDYFYAPTQSSKQTLIVLSVAWAGFGIFAYWNRRQHTKPLEN